MATQVPPPGSVIVADWHRCKESKEYFNKILRKKKRKNFGLLESPVMPPHLTVDTVHYKVFISGKSGVGKSALAARLAGLNIPIMHHETTGIETTVVYWPVKLRESGRVLFFRLQFWDCGENALRRFDHLLPSCKEQVDAVLFLFSFTDRTSFDDLSNQIVKWNESSYGCVVKVVIGTKFDLFMHCDVAQRDVRKFQERWRIPVLRTGGDIADGLGDVAPILNCLVESLWQQDCTAAGGGCQHTQQETATLF
ncbi:ciliogenesis and planar polarity effector 2 isoform X2 [Kryptolebias marmoratus]|uniref:ciliogenesis and planar polarity effector 2 isoform X2 n=1 Tax=Kryptolebias marmoratus TaxID=37003 RepID=UPI0007F89D37|nr:ciliogenesis and planar polarity effector 2 isoform X2 [Kryptolebias marmoratus]